MELPIELRQAVEQQAATIPLPRLRQLSQALSERYRSESGTGARLLTGDEEAIAYATVRMPATYGAVFRALSSALETCPDRPRTLLDVGAGTGTASWAASELLELERVTCLEREKTMLQLGQCFMASGAPCLRNAAWRTFDVKRPDQRYKSDLVIASYVLNELAPTDRIAALRWLWEQTGMALLLVEPGTPTGYAQVKAAREALLSQGAHLAAPCPHEGPCPLPKDDWCHFSCRVSRSKLHKLLKDGDAPYEDEKFAFAAFTRRDCPDKRARVLRHPLVEKGRVTLSLCALSGLETRQITQKDKPLFKRARKLRWGDAF